jgi:hypothetical protein
MPLAFFVEKIKTRVAPGACPRKSPCTAARPDGRSLLKIGGDDIKIAVRKVQNGAQ